MTSSRLQSAKLQSIAERGLGAFLLALAKVAPDEDRQKALDCWIRALETTEWRHGESSDAFIRHITINARALAAKLK